MKTKITLLIALITFSVTSTFAHALWIQTASTGKKGQAQEIKVFFGEYAEKNPDSVAKWFSNLKDFKLTVTAPDGTVQNLVTTADIKNYKATFTPDKDGTYIIAIVHDVAAVYSKAKIQYYAYANINVGKSKANTNLPTSALLTINPTKPVLKTGDAGAHQVLFNKAAFTDKKVEVITPSYKKEEAKTDAKGNFAFKPAEKGGYFLEAFAEDKTTGQQNGSDYEKVWHVATYYTEVI
jgi:uncharacterized GH25 family protein